MGASRTAIADMTRWGLAVAIDAIRLAAGAMNGDGSHGTAQSQKQPSYTITNRLEALPDAQTVPYNQIRGRLPPSQRPPAARSAGAWSAAPVHGRCAAL